MKIVHKIILSNIFDILLIVVTGIFAYHNLNLVLTKLRFAEIADDLNASLLEMRLSEKNYFLYGDGSVLSDIRKKIDESVEAIAANQQDIRRATGEKNLQQLESNLQEYRAAIDETMAGTQSYAETQNHVREVGQKLREFSSEITHIERNKVNEIISSSRNGLFSSLCLILLSALGVSQVTFRKILKSLKSIEKVAHSISEGDFGNLQAVTSKDELGSVMKAINSMSEELKNREEIIIQSKKLASIGILTAGVAHELGNPLNNISMMAQAYVELYDNLSEEDRLDFMKKIEEETDRIKEIVTNLLDFSKPKKPNLKQINANDIIQKSLKLVQNMICVCNLEAHLDLQDKLPPVLVDEPQIQEVLINLITNSIHASNPGDQLIIASRLSTDCACIEIEVKDTGKGIPPELLPHIFDPFFTTKGASGTGLGLFVSYGIVKNHKGTIRVSSEVGTGTCFTMELPVCGKEHTDENGRS